MNIVGHEGTSGENEQALLTDSPTLTDTNSTADGETAPVEVNTVTSDGETALVEDKTVTADGETASVEDHTVSVDNEVMAAVP